MTDTPSDDSSGQGSEDTADTDGILERPDAVLPADMESWDARARWDFLAFRLSREQMLTILAEVVGFDNPGDQDRTRLTVDELAAVLDELGVIREWQRQQLVEDGRSRRSEPGGRTSRSGSQPDREDREQP